MTVQFQKSVLVYIPCRNCEKSLIEVLYGIPVELHNEIDCLIIDNYSTDGTSAVALNEIRKKKFPFTVKIIRTRYDIGYAGSQKLAYTLACQSPNVQYVVMLHGDGQYPAGLLKEFLAWRNKNYAIINGYRDKEYYSEKEETPLETYFVIKFLSWLENVATGCSQKEWHSGFVMYKKEFLKKIPLQCLSDMPHIDGEFLLCARILAENTLAIPIYKKYKDYEAFSMLGRIKHVINVFKIILRFRTGYYHEIIKKGIASNINFDVDVLV